MRKEIFIFLCFNGPFYFIFGNFIDQLFGKMAGNSQMNKVIFGNRFLIFTMFGLNMEGYEENADFFCTLLGIA